MRKLLLLPVVALLLTACGTTAGAMDNCVRYLADTAINQYKNTPDAETRRGWWEWAESQCEGLLAEDGEEAFNDLWGDPIPPAPRQE